MEVLGGKVRQLDLIKRKLGLKKNNMIFFDDSESNISRAIGEGYTNSHETKPFSESQGLKELLVFVEEKKNPYFIIDSENTYNQLLNNYKKKPTENNDFLFLKDDRRNAIYR